MADELLEADAVEEGEGSSLAAGASQGEVRPLPARGEPGEIEAWRGDVRTVAVAAAGGLVAGAATVAAVSAVRAGARRGIGRAARRRRSERDKIVASRSFLIDIHMLGR
jgi:hypothetical protein